MKTLIQKLRNMNGRRVITAIVGGGMVVLLSGGTAVAASKIGTEDIQNYAITKTKIRGDAVGSWEVIDRSLRGGDFRKDSLGRYVFTPHLRDMIEQWEAGDFAKPGPKGDPGADGADGSDGKDGADGVSGYEVISKEEIKFSSGLKELSVSCPEGKYAISGGYEASNDNANGANTVVHASQATDLTQLDDGTSRSTGWMVRYTLDHVLGTMKVQVTCASAE